MYLFLIILQLVLFFPGAYAVTPAEKVVKGLQEKGRLPGEVEKIKQLETPQSNIAESVIFISVKDEGGTCKLAAKVFEEVEGYKHEKRILGGQDMLNYMEMVNQYRKECGMPLPYLVGYKGATKIEGQGVILMEKAKGKTLKEIYAMLPQIEDTRIQKMFYTIGQQMGRLDALFYKNNNGQRLVHVDGHSANFMYDERGEQLYWIDLEEVQLKDWGMTLEGSLAFGHHLFPDLDLHRVLSVLKTESEAQALLLMIKKHLIAAKSLYERYSQEIKGIGKDREIVSSYNDRVLKGYNLIVSRAFQYLKNNFSIESDFSVDDYRIE